MEDKPPRQLGMFTYLCKECDKYKLCGGTDRAPCTCVYKLKKNKLDCKDCQIYCSERDKDIDIGIQFKTLNELEIFQPKKITLPPFIPLRTNQVNNDCLVDFNWVGVDAKVLFCKSRKKNAADLKKFFASEEATRSHLKVTKNANLMVILNGSDDILELFWTARRSELFNRLRDSGFIALTGPTFSIITKSRPTYHNINMLLRHHKVLSEIADAGLIAIPNLYSVTNVDRAIWSKWLKDSPDVWIVSRDFSRTKATRSLKAEFGEMVEILSATGRAFHVILVGVALRNSLKIVPPLIELGHSCSIATSFPVLKGFGGLEIRFDNLSGQVEYVLKPDKTLVEIAEANLRVARKFFHRFMSYEAKESSPKKRIA